MSTTTLQSLDAGVQDVVVAARTLAERLPAPLQALGELAYNYRWSWTLGGPELFEQIDPQRWALCANSPVRESQRQIKLAPALRGPVAPPPRCCVRSRTRTNRRQLPLRGLSWARLYACWRVRHADNRQASKNSHW